MIVNAIGYFMAAYVGLFFAFVFIIWLKKIALHNQVSYPRLSKYVYNTFAAVFYVSDVAFNIAYGSLFFLEIPNKHHEGWMLTYRLRWHISEGKTDLLYRDEPSWRFWLALFICEHLIEPIDPNHCGLDA